MLSAKRPVLETLNSRLVPELFDIEKLGDGQPIRVLDLGPANSHTFRYLSQFNCRLQVIDIQQKLVKLNDLKRADPEMSATEVIALLEDAFAFDGDEIFDVCLIWDFLNYLDISILPLFSKVLLPHLAHNGKLYGFAVLNKTTPLTQQNYGITDTELLSVTDQNNLELPYRHSQSAVSDAMTGTTVKQSVLRADGRLEIILIRP